MNEERKAEVPHGVVTGRLEELRRLEAAERALADAFCAYARAAAGGSRLLHLTERHRNIAALLGERIVALGGRPQVDPDDQWLAGPPEKLATIVYAEKAAQRTYHDHLLDMDPDTQQIIRDHILPAHDSTLELLTGEGGLMQPTPEYG